jgi:branched-chain amino acid transport system ATP-binding protein
MSALLTMHDVTAGYVADIDILRHINLKVEATSITGLIGLNGAGKSTIMKTICGFLPPRDGVIRFDGQNITGIAAHEVIDRGISYIPQESSLFPHMSVENNLRLPLEHLARSQGAKGAGAAGQDRPGGGIARGEIPARLDDMYQKFPALKDKRHAKAGDLSGGQQKMLEFAKAYLVRPRLCLIDEPGIGLAPKIAEEVYQWIDLFAAESMAILLVDHNVRRVVKMSRYIYVLSLGEITAEGGPEAFAGDLHEQVKAGSGSIFETKFANFGGELIEQTYVCFEASPKNSATSDFAFSSASSASVGRCGLSRVALTMHRKPSGSFVVARNWCQVQAGTVTRSLGSTARTSVPTKQRPRPRRISTPCMCSWRSSEENPPGATSK